VIVSTLTWDRLDPGNALARAWMTAPAALRGVLPYVAREPRSRRPLLEA